MQSPAIVDRKPGAINLAVLWIGDLAGPFARIGFGEALDDFQAAARIAAHVLGQRLARGSRGEAHNTAAEQ